MVFPRPAVMPSGIQPDGRSICEGNRECAATGLATTPRAIATAMRMVRDRRVISNLRGSWRGDDGGQIATELVTARCVRLAKTLRRIAQIGFWEGLTSSAERCTVPIGYITK